MKYFKDNKMWQEEFLFSNLNSQREFGFVLDKKVLTIGDFLIYDSIN